MFHIKICGITSIDDAMLAVHHGADAIGINFWQGSPRYVSARRAIEIAAAVRNNSVVVGVFVDAEINAIRQAVDDVGIDMIQLHGNEPPQITRELTSPVIKVFRLGQTSVTDILHYVDVAQQNSTNFSGILLDAFVEDTPGGSGRLADWSAARDLIDRRPATPVILAGGLNRNNVAEAIRQVRPHGVDVASGVEKRLGEKSGPKIADFVQAAQEALHKGPR